MRTMTRYLMSIFLVLAVMLYPAASIGRHVESDETNVVILACGISIDPPYRIDVVSSSVNMTTKPIPIVTRKHSCSQTLHELMTAGFEIVESNLEDLTFVFVLTRQDQSTEKH